MTSLRLAVIGSSNGGSLARFAGILAKSGVALELMVFTDRECGLERLRLPMPYRNYRIEERDNGKFSESAARLLREQGGVDVVVLFFTRLVGKPIYESWPTLNLHESLLPAYPGFHALQKAHRDSVPTFGTTLHLVDASVDGGAILAQARAPRLPSDDPDQMARISFLQKIYLLLHLVEAKRAGVAFNQAGLLSYFSGCTNPAGAWSPRLSDASLEQCVVEVDQEERIGLFGRLEDV